MGRGLTLVLIVAGGVASAVGSARVATVCGGAAVAGVVAPAKLCAVGCCGAHAVQAATAQPAKAITCFRMCAQ